MTFYLLKSVKNNTHKNQQRSSTKELCKFSLNSKYPCKSWQYSNDS